MTDDEEKDEEDEKEMIQVRERGEMKGNGTRAAEDFWLVNGSATRCWQGMQPLRLHFGGIKSVIGSVAQVPPFDRHSTRHVHCQVHQSEDVVPSAVSAAKAHNCFSQANHKLPRVKQLHLPFLIITSSLPSRPRHVPNGSHGCPLLHL